MLASLQLVLEQGLATPSHHNIEAIGKTLKRARCIEIELCCQAICRRLVGNRCDDRIVGDERIPFEIHLRYQSLREAGSENRKMNVSRSPAVDTVPERIRARLDRSEEIVTAFVGQHSAAAAEIGIDRRNIGVVAMTVASAGIGLPHFDESVGYGVAVAIENVAVDDRLFADRFAILGIVEDEVIIERTEFVRRKDRTRYLRQRVLQRPKRDARRAQHAGLVNGRIRRGMNISVTLVKLGFRSHDDTTSPRVLNDYKELATAVGSLLKGRRPH